MLRPFVAYLRVYEPLLALGDPPDEQKLFSDSQAIQLAMITLLLSIFFSGFFISLDSFARPALLLSYSIPMTHGVQGFQSLMLRGLPPSALTWGALALIALVTFALVVLLTRRQFRNA